MKARVSTLSISLLLATSAAFSQTAPSELSQGTAAAAATSMTDPINGEVRKVDKGARKITLRHGEIKQLDMPAMTMVFQVKDSSMLDAVNVGDKVAFKAENVGGAFTITEIQMAK